MAVTYEPIASQTLGSNTGTVTFSSIPATYTDLILVCDYAMTTDANSYFRVGASSADTGSNYSQTHLSGNGSTASSGRRSNNDAVLIANANGRGTNNRNAVVIHFMSYANTNVYKTTLTTSAAPSVDVFREVGLWRSTSAIGVISLLSNGNYASGSTFSLFGVKAA